MNVRKGYAFPGYNSDGGYASDLPEPICIFFFPQKHQKRKTTHLRRKTGLNPDVCGAEEQGV
jgi:hypothetical protein